MDSNLQRSISKRGPRGFKRFTFWFLLACVVICGGLIFLSIRSDQQRLKELAAVPLPPEMEFHRQLTLAQEGPATNQPPAPEVRAVLDTIDAWTALCARKESEVDGETWDAILELWQSVESWDELDTEQQARLIAFIEGHAEFFREFCAVAARGGPVVAVNPSDNGGQVSPHLSKMRDFSRLVGLATVVYARTGKADEAIKLGIAGARLFDAIAKEPAHFNQLVRYGMAGIWHHTLLDAFPPGALPDDGTTRLLNAVRETAGRDLLAAAWREARIGVGHELNTMLSKNWTGRFDEFHGLFRRNDRGLGTRLYFVAYTSPILRPWANADASRVAEFYRVLEETHRMPYYEAVGIIRARESDLTGLAYPMTNLAQYIVGDGTRAQASHEVRMQLTQLGFLVEQHQRHAGSPPTTLSAVAAHLPEEMMTDPFSGRPFVYRVTEDGFVLYSVGPNEVDDGGTRHTTGMNGDFIWRGRAGSS